MLFKMNLISREHLNCLVKLTMNITIQFRFSMDIRFTSSSSKARKWVINFCKRLESFKYNGGLTKEELPYKIALQFERKAGTTSSPLVEIDEHSKSINAAIVSGDGKIMVSVSLDNTVRTWSNFILPGSKPACEVGLSSRDSVH